MDAPRTNLKIKVKNIKDRFCAASERYAASLGKTHVSLDVFDNSGNRMNDHNIILKKLSQMTRHNHIKSIFSHLSQVEYKNDNCTVTLDVNDSKEQRKQQPTSLPRGSLQRPLFSHIPFQSDSSVFMHSFPVAQADFLLGSSNGDTFDHVDQEQNSDAGGVVLTDGVGLGPDDTAIQDNEKSTKVTTPDSTPDSHKITVSNTGNNTCLMDGRANIYDVSADLLSQNEVIKTPSDYIEPGDIFTSTDSLEATTAKNNNLDTTNQTEYSQHISDKLATHYRTCSTTDGTVTLQVDEKVHLSASPEDLNIVQNKKSHIAEAVTDKCLQDRNVSEPTEENTNSDRKDIHVRHPTPLDLEGSDIILNVGEIVNVSNSLIGDQFLSDTHTTRDIPDSIEYKDVPSIVRADSSNKNTCVVPSNTADNVSKDSKSNIIGVFTSVSHDLPTALKSNYVEEITKNHVNVAIDQSQYEGMTSVTNNVIDDKPYISSCINTDFEDGQNCRDIIISRNSLSAQIKELRRTCDIDQQALASNKFKSHRDDAMYCHSSVPVERNDHLKPKHHKTMFSPDTQQCKFKGQKRSSAMMVSFHIDATPPRKIQRKELNDFVDNMNLYDQSSPNITNSPKVASANSDVGSLDVSSSSTVTLYNKDSNNNVTVLSQKSVCKTTDSGVPGKPNLYEPFVLCQIAYMPLNIRKKEKIPKKKLRKEAVNIPLILSENSRVRDPRIKKKKQNKLSKRTIIIPLSPIGDTMLVDPRLRVKSETSKEEVINDIHLPTPTLDEKQPYTVYGEIISPCAKSDVSHEQRELVNFLRDDNIQPLNPLASFLNSTNRPTFLEVYKTEDQCESDRLDSNKSSCKQEMLEGFSTPDNRNLSTNICVSETVADRKGAMTFPDQPRSPLYSPTKHGIDTAFSTSTSEGLYTGRCRREGADNPRPPSSSPSHDQPHPYTLPPPPPPLPPPPPPPPSGCSPPAQMSTDNGNLAAMSAYNCTTGNMMHQETSWDYHQQPWGGYQWPFYSSTSAYPSYYNWQ